MRPTNLSAADVTKIRDIASKRQSFCGTADAQDSSDVCLTNSRNARMIFPQLRFSSFVRDGAALKGRRDKMYIAADDIEYAMRQNRHRNREGQMQSIESCLRKLRTDHLDVWRPQFKLLGGHRYVDLELCIAVFEKARSQGKVRFLGLSTHDRPWMPHVIERFPRYRVLYVPYAPGSADLSLADHKLLEAAHAEDVSVILAPSPGPKAVFSTGTQGSADGNRQTTRLTLTRILSNEDISAVAVNMGLPSDVDSVVQASPGRHALL